MSDLRVQLRYIPNQLTALRLLSVPVLWVLALLDLPRLVGAGLILALMTDVLDGMLARRLRQTSAFGAAFDSLADKLLTFSVVGWLVLLRPEMFREHPLWIGVAAASFAMSLLIGWIKWGRPAPLHLLSSRLGGGVQALFVLHALLAESYSPALLALALGLGTLAALEEILVQLTRSHVDAEIRSIVPPPPLTLHPAELLARRRMLWLLPLMAVLLTLPALATGWQFDDYLHRAALTSTAADPTLRPALMDLFVFMDGDPAHAQQRMVSGEFPWWTLPNGKVAFWRPLSGVTHWLDYRWWPSQPTLMHAQSLAWFAALIVAVTLLYRRIMGATALAGLAALLYAVDDAHGFAVAWLSNRNVLLATLCSCLALLAHDRWRREGWRWGAVGAPLCLLLGLLSAEAATATMAYLLAYTLVLDRADWRGRLLALLPSSLVVLLWRLIYRALGYGAWGTSYIDPLTEPLRYLGAVAIHGPLLLLGQWALPPAELVPFVPSWAMALLWLGALLVIALLAWLLWPQRHDDVARFWAIGMLLALLPISAALPANRLLFFVGLGAMGLLAGLVGRLRQQWRETRRAVRLVSAGLLIIHLALAPLLLPLTAWSPALLGSIEPSIASLPRDPALIEQTAVILNAPSFFSTSYIPLVRQAQGLPAPARIRYLGAGPVALDVRRSDARTLIVRPSGGYLTGFDMVFRDPTYRFGIGETIELPDMRATVLATVADGRPAEVAFQFATALDDPMLRWLQWHDGRYVPFVPPAVGQSVQLPAATPWTALFSAP